MEANITKPVTNYSKPVLQTIAVMVIFLTVIVSGFASYFFNLAGELGSTWIYIVFGVLSVLSIMSVFLFTERNYIIIATAFASFASASVHPAFTNYYGSNEPMLALAIAAFVLSSFVLTYTAVRSVIELIGNLYT